MTRVTPAVPGLPAVPVVVVGGGPAGLALALELGRHAVPVIVVEPRRLVDRTRPRAKTTSTRTMELFRRWGVADRIRAAAALPVAWSDRVTFCSTVTGPEITSFTGVFGLDLGDSELVAEPGQQIPQPVVEQVLRRAVDALPSATLLLGGRGVSVDIGPENCRVEIEHDDGSRQVVVADFVVGADGPRSLVRRGIGASYLGSPTGAPNVNIVFRSEALAALIPHPPSVHYWVLNPESPGVVGPLDLTGTWWAIATGTASVADDVEAARIVRRMIGPADIDVEVVATDPWQAQTLLADRYRKGRAFLIGDAAHQNPPWGGHGFNTGTSDAMNLGWKLAAVINGWAPEALLDSYEAERRPIAQATLAAAGANTSALSRDLSDPDLMATGPAFDQARERAATSVQVLKDAEFHSLGLVLGSGYTAAAATQAPAIGVYEPQVAAGCRLPHRRLADGRSLFDLLGAGLTVIGSARSVGPFVRAAAERHIPLTTVDLDATSVPHSSVAAILVRPDQYIAWTGAVADDREANDVLRSALLGFQPGSGTA